MIFCKWSGQEYSSGIFFDNVYANVKTLYQQGFASFKNYKVFENEQFHVRLRSANLPVAIIKNWRIKVKTFMLVIFAPFFKSFKVI